MSPLFYTPNQFDRSKPFYPLVMNYLVLLAGFKELACRAVVGPEDINEVVRRLCAGRTFDHAEQRAAFEKKINQLFGPLELRSEFQTETIRVDPNEIASELAGNIQYVASFLLRSAGSLLILAHELCKDQDYYDETHQLWQFLRHCRNAAAHGGHFHFSKSEPRCPATWGSFQITRDLEGGALFKDPQTNGLLSVGDPIRLLWDLEQAFPAMHM